MQKLILASTSKYRKQLLSQLGYPFSCENPDVDESILKKSNMHPEQLALKLSSLKARSVFSRFPEAIIIGSDQVCVCKGEIFSKPKSFENAFIQLKIMSASSHQLISAVTICTPQEEISFSNITTLHMRALSDDEITKYLRADTPYDCAGSYKLESMGIRLFEKIDMTDHTSIVGLPLLQLNNALIKLGLNL